MVVVGSGGRPRWARWAAVRSAYGWERRPSASVTAAALARTAGSRVIGEFAREARSARLAASSAATAPVPRASPLARGDDLPGLLLGEGEPAQDLRVDVPLGRGVDRHVEQGAGSGHVDPVGEAEERAEGGQGLLEVVDPDVAAVHHAGDEPLAGQAPDRGQRVEVRGCRAGEVERQSVDRGLRQNRQGVAEPIEVGGHQQPGAVGEGAEVAVGASGGVELGPGAVLDEGGLVELHPLRPGGAQVGQHLGVDGQQAVQEGQRFEVRGHAGCGLGQQEVGDRADQHGAGGVAEGEGLLELGDLLVGVGREDGVGAELRHQVVVVRVEPLGHFEGGHVLGATGHREVPVEGVGGHGLTVPPGDGADHDTGVQDVVVVREVAGRHLVDAGVDQPPPGRPAQVRRGLPEGVGADTALPVTLDGLLQLPVGALAGEAVHGGACCRGCGLRCHGNLLREMTP
ncbi:hypothetical protein GCM10020227_25890 [Streptomyces flavovirens]